MQYYYTTLLIARKLLGSHISFHFSNPLYHSLHRFDANFRIYLPFPTSVENQLFPSDPNVCIILADRPPGESTCHCPPLPLLSRPDDPVSRLLRIDWSLFILQVAVHEPLSSLVYIYIYKCVEIFRERVEFAARDPFLSVSIESFVSARFQRVISRGKFDRSDDNSLLCPRLLLYSFVYSPPPPPPEIYKAVRFQMYNRIYNWILHNSSIEAHRARLPSCLPSFLPSLRELCPRYIRFGAHVQRKRWKLDRYPPFERPPPPISPIHDYTSDDIFPQTFPLTFVSSNED